MPGVIRQKKKKKCNSSNLDTNNTGKNKRWIEFSFGHGKSEKSKEWILNEYTKDTLLPKQVS